MPQRNALRGIAHGLLGTFVSRNNDIGGYWGLGVLRLVAQQNGLDKLIIDLLNEDRHVSPVTSVEETYRDWLFQRMEKFAIDKASLTNAEIRLRFASFDEFPNAIRDTRGYPYVCTVRFKTDLGPEYSAESIGVCSAHDPTSESKSTRE
ncbi:MAG TPA: hypothetical protein VK612_02965 [Pyrinomonadaceae bacterium]|nr:hypothetical protein [Pyrinomonadaceae bacterium]